MNELPYQEWLRRVREWLFHYTTLTDWSLVDTREHWVGGQAPQDYAKFLIEATA